VRVNLRFLLAHHHKAERHQTLGDGPAGKKEPNIGDCSRNTESDVQRRTDFQFFDLKPVVSRRFNRSWVRNARNQSATNKNIPQPNQPNDKNPNLLQNFNKIKAQTTISTKKITLTARK